MGTPFLEKYFRIAQLNGEIDSTISFCVRPLSSSSLGSHYQKFSTVKHTDKGRFTYGFLPITQRIEYNSKNPFGWNNGSLVGSRGIQSLTGFGAYVNSGPLKIQLRPEITFVQNQHFEGFPKEHPESVWIRRYRRHWNRIDLPERYGTSPELDLFLGQSFLKLSVLNIDVGISSENLWWGPGRQGSLTMTNNAAGFLHLTLNSTRPMKSWIGTFEWQVVGGRLENWSGPFPSRDSLDVSRLLNPKNNNWRYLNGVLFTYQPKWVPGLFLGLTRTFQQYADSARARNDYLPIFFLLFRGNDSGLTDDRSERDQLASVFFRWIWEEAQTEIYGEYGRNDAAWNLRDLAHVPEHSRAYLLGFTKIFPIANQKTIELSFETVHFEKSKSTLLRAEPVWYTHSSTRQGYTHHGEIVGSGIGPGSNCQIVEVGVWGENTSYGLSASRIANDNDFYKNPVDLEDDNIWNQFESGEKEVAKWTDTALEVFYGRQLNKWLFDFRISSVFRKNYQWLHDNDLFNLHLSMNVAYQLN